MFPGKPGRTATHMMIGLAHNGRFWTLHILESDRNGIWRPITAGPVPGQKTSCIRNRRDEHEAKDKEQKGRKGAAASA